MTKPEPAFSEVQAALDASKDGDAWPYLILQFNAGNKAPLAAAIRAFGVEPHSASALFIADMLEGKFKRTRHHENVSRQHEVLALVHRYSLWVDWTKANRGQRHVNMRAGDADMRNLQNVYERVATELFMTPDAVEKAVKRDKRRKRL
ncbi:hypothetical protein [Polaromonas sp. C04]|uniref:hypothetical protein n=1 Tax=Polaromonas sp. C04 TaxID=1945857 RepID=UPI0009878588|nr:hypothetical protein [Polaromonas sp. C04]OOG57451.1 hypothetical protein B0E49_05055 [Polaromonas sp. C04]